MSLELAGKGAACVDISFAARYTHSPIETCDLNDIADTARLVAQMARESENITLERL